MREMEFGSSKVESQVSWEEKGELHAQERDWYEDNSKC